MTPGWIVVNADDLGVSRGTTQAVIRAHREGIVTSASLAVTTSGYGHAVASCVRECPDLGIGLHFTVTSGRPVRPSSVLAGDDGFFRWRFSSLFAAVAIQRRAELLDQLRLELDAQLDRLDADGIQPDHIDSERHVHLIPGIFELVVAAAESRRIPFVRAGVDAGVGRFPLAQIPGLALRGGMIKATLLSAFARRGQRRLGTRRTAEYVASYFGSGRTHLLKDDIARSMAGSMEIMVHPGVVDPGERP
ncbi:MAG TPA: ChbG/HpnK family deacetylase, partial [Gemmatimonadaceae bacterium]